MSHFIRFSILLSLSAVICAGADHTRAFAEPYANEAYVDDGLRDDAGDEQLSAADELYRDGLDSLQDDRPDLARKFFQYLLSHHPAAPAAGKARRELARLDRLDEAEARDMGLDGDDAAAATAKEPAAAASAAVPAQIPIKVPAQPLVKVARPPLPRPDATIYELSQTLTRVIGDRVFFADSSADLGGRARSLLTAQARWLIHRPTLAITVTGHADDSGTASDNATLSLKRAESVRNQLIESGVAPERIKIQSMGSGAPVAVCPSSQCQAQNRRAVSLLSFVEQPQPAIAVAPAASPVSSVNTRADKGGPHDGQPLEQTVPTIR